MTIFSATFSAVAISAAQDVFELVAPANKRVKIREVRIGQYTDFGDAAAEILSVLIIRGFTTAGSGGGTAVPSALGANAKALSTVLINNTGLAVNGTTKTPIADTMNIQAGWWYRPPEDERIIINQNERVVVRITAPADAVTTNATLIFEEVD